MAILGKDQLVIVGVCSTGLPAAQVPLPSPPAENWSFAGGSDAFITLFDASDRSIWSTYYGGSGPDGAVDVRTNDKSIYVLGRTRSSNIPTQYSAGSYFDNTLNGFMDTFLLEFKPNGDLVWGTYFGGTGDEDPGLNGLAIDRASQALYIVGATWGNSIPTDFPVFQGLGIGVYYDGIPSTGIDGFVARFSITDRSRKWVTLFGSGPGASGFHIPETVVGDYAGNIYIAGHTVDGTLAYNFPNFYNQPLINPNSSLAGAADGFIARFSSANTRQWCSYFGRYAGTANESIETLTYNDNDIYAAGYTSKGINLTTYFPLAQPSNSAGYFDPNYNDVLPPKTDGFISVFCSTAQPFKSLEQGDPAPLQALTPYSLSSLGQDWYSLQGQGRNSIVKVFDVMGRPVRVIALHWGDTGSNPFFLGDLVTGVYLLRSDDGAYQGKVIVSH